MQVCSCSRSNALSKNGVLQMYVCKERSRKYLYFLQMYFTATTHVTLWFQKWRTRNSAWCNPTLYLSYVHHAWAIFNSRMRGMMVLIIDAGMR